MVQLYELSISFKNWDSYQNKCLFLEGIENIPQGLLQINSPPPQKEAKIDIEVSLSSRLPSA